MYKLKIDFEAAILLERFALEISQLQPMKERDGITSDTDVSESEISLSE